MNNEQCGTETKMQGKTAEAIGFKSVQPAKATTQATASEALSVVVNFIKFPLGLIRSSFVSESPKVLVCRVVARSSLESGRSASQHTVLHKAKFALRLQLKSAKCRSAATIFPQCRPSKLKPH